MVILYITLVYKLFNILSLHTLTIVVLPFTLPVFREGSFGGCWVLNNVWQYSLMSACLVTREALWPAGGDTEQSQTKGWWVWVGGNSLLYSSSNDTFFNFSIEKRAWAPCWNNIHTLYLIGHMGTCSSICKSWLISSEHNMESSDSDLFWLFIVHHELYLTHYILPATLEVFYVSFISVGRSESLTGGNQDSRMLN